MRWRSLLSPARVAAATRLEAHALGVIARNGMPDALLQFLGGLGDELLLTCVARELVKRRPGVRVWQVSAAAELLRDNDDYHRVFGPEEWALRHSLLLRRARVALRYSDTLEDKKREAPPAEHILAVLCRRAGIRGEIALRPHCAIGRDEAQREERERACRCAGEAGEAGGHEPGRGPEPAQVTVHSVGEGSHANVMRNKLWFHDRMQAVVDGIRAAHPGVAVVQVGLAGDPPLARVVDRRGCLSLHGTAAQLARSACFVGTSGLLSHLARAVDCRSVIIYGGREHAWQTGYPCNENLESHPACAPCWRWSDCERDRECLRAIAPEAVLAAVGRVLARRGEPLAVETARLGDG